MGHLYRQLTQEERYQISALTKLRMSQAATAQRLGRSRCTVGRELHRNADRRGYEGAQAQRTSDRRRREAAKHHKRHGTLIDWVEARLADRWSPEQIAGSMKANGYPLVSHEWIYRHVARDFATGGTLYKQLRQRKKKYRRWYGTGRRPCRIPNRIGIEQRPCIVDKRQRVGDWEGDTVVGPGRGALVTFVERKTGVIALRRVSRATARHTAAAVVSGLGRVDADAGQWNRVRGARDRG